MKVLEIITSTLSTILFYFLLSFFLFIDSCFLIQAVITQTFNLTAELVIPTGIPMTEAQAEIETTNKIRS